MTAEPERPSSQTLESWWATQRVGRPGRAREQALDAARSDSPNAHIHFFDATCAALVAGEPRAAERLLGECEAAAPSDETWPRRIAACRAWAWTVDRLWYPGDVAAEIASAEGMPKFPRSQPGDEETQILERVTNGLHSFLSLRWKVEWEVRRKPEKALAAVRKEGERLGPSPPPLARLEVAHLLDRAGKLDEATAMLADIRKQLENGFASDIQDRVGLACTFLVEGDWYATPGSSPEALGFDLAITDAPSPFLDRRDLPRAAAAYDQAAAHLAGVEEPRVQGALALRRAALAWLSRDYAAQQVFLETAATDFAAAGDVAPQWLATVHRLLAQVALGQVAATRLAAGTGFDLEPRGQIAALVHWGMHDGSSSWTTGLGRLLQRAAASWGERGDYARAELAYEMAVPLVPASGAEVPATVLLELAALDRSNGCGIRALTRTRAAVATLPPVTNAARDLLSLLGLYRNLNALGSVLTGELTAGATAAGVQVAALEWAVERTRELLALPGVPAGRGRHARRAWWWLTRALRPPLSLLQLASMYMVVGLTDTIRESVSFAEASVAFERGRQLAAVGASAGAEGRYDAALAKIRSSRDSRPMEVIFLADLDRFEEARTRLRELLPQQGLSVELLAIAAVRAQDYETALRLFGREPKDGTAWFDLADHAEAALGAGDIKLAVSLTDRAVRDFEERLGRLQRDSDRVAASDDAELASLYLVSARAQLARAEQLDGEAADSDAAATARSLAFGFSDRARAFALAALLADASDDTDDERLILAWRQATSECQAAYDRLYRAYVTAADDEEVDERVAGVASAENRLVQVEASLERTTATTRRRATHAKPTTLEDVQGVLPANAALVEYELAGRELLVWAITSESAFATTSRHRQGTVARLAMAVQRSCANGDPGPEATELAEILLAPVASVVDTCDRLVIVPYGPLHGLPFQVLPHHGRTLGETHVISYLPAAALLLGATVDAPPIEARALVVGDPAFDAAGHPSLSRLPGAAVEATAVAKTHGVRPLIGSDAGEDAIRSGLADANLVHLAAHGRLDPIAPSDSSIVLAGRDELTVSDLVGLQIDAELAVLSACDSGRGAASLGGDVVGLARGLIAAGARRSVVSLWPVDDAPACATMSLFHEHLAGGVPAAQALHAAQQAVRGMSGDDIAARYVELGGDPGETATTRRRGAPSADPAPTLPLDPEFVDNLADDEPVDVLSGELARVWAPFVVIGV